MPKTRRLLVTLSMTLPLVAALGSPGGATTGLQLTEFRVNEKAMCDIRQEWMNEILATHREGTWAKMEFRPTDSQLKRMGLPSSEVLNARTYENPTIVSADGRTQELSMAEFQEAAVPALASYAGTGCLGIRPGAWLLLLSGGGVGWCSLAHVTGAAGSYDVTTAGHCGKSGDTATVIAAYGNRGGVAGPVLLDFGRFASSVDGGLGNDYATIDIDAAAQPLVTPTMCFWGGPRGVFTKSGGVATVSVPRRLPAVPSVTVTPDPFLAQSIVHYGHGTGVGAGGTPRAGEAIHWGATHFMFFGAISPGDSGSGANTLLGDTAGANMEAAGIMTHLYVDPLMRQGLGIMGGTRTTKVGTPANGQIVPYPAPVQGLP